MQQKKFYNVYMYRPKMATLDSRDEVFAVYRHRVKTRLSKRMAMCYFTKFYFPNYSYQVTLINVFLSFLYISLYLYVYKCFEKCCL